MVQTSISLDDFTDAVNSRVSVPNVDRYIGGLGVVAETGRRWGDKAFSMRGSLDFERMFGGRRTLAWVSGEALRTQAPRDGVLLGVDGTYRWGRFSIGAGVSAQTALDSRTRDYSGFVRLGIHF